MCVCVQIICIDDCGCDNTVTKSRVYFLRNLHRAQQITSDPCQIVTRTRSPAGGGGAAEGFARFCLSSQPPGLVVILTASQLRCAGGSLSVFSAAYDAVRYPLVCLEGKLLIV